MRGGVQAVTNAIIDANTSTGIFGWGLSHVRRVVAAVVPAWAREANPPSTTPSPGRWYEMAQLFNASTTQWVSGTALDMTLRTEGLAKFANAAAVRTAVGNFSIPMVALQRSSDDEVVIKPLAANFSDPDASDDYRVNFYFRGADNAAERVEVRFTASAITLTPHYADPGTVRFDLGVFA